MRAGIGLRGSLHEKQHQKLLVLPHSIAAKTIVQEVVVLQRIRTSGLEHPIYPQGWVNTIKVVRI